MVGCFLSLSVTDKTTASPTTSTITIPAAWSEIEVIRSIVSYCIPRFLGLNAIWSESAGPAADHFSAAPLAPSAVPISTFDEEPSEGTPPAADPATTTTAAAPAGVKKTWARK